MRCQECGGTLRVKHTEDGSKYVIRFRKCDKCGKTVKTIEEHPEQTGH